MIKTGKAQLLLISFLCLMLSPVLAQQPSIELTLSNNKIFPGEQVNLNLSVSGSQTSNFTRPDLPEIDGLRWLVNSSQRSTSYTIVNGQPSITYSYTYTLVAEEPGNYVIPTFGIEVNEKVYYTKAIPFEVIDRDALPDSDPDKYPDVFVQVELDDESPVPGQQVIASVVLYFKSGIEVASYQPTPGWKAEGFWKESLEDVRSPTATSVIKGGVRFRKAKLLQYALFPTKSGELELSPYEVTLTIRNRSSRLTDFFNFGSNQSRVSVNSDPVTVKVQELPDPGNALYLGAVGDFQIKRELSVDEALVGESVEVITTINGEGNVPLIPKPEFEYPGGLEKYEPQESSNISRRGDKITGFKTFSDILIARNPGSYTIPAVTVAWFNPDSKSYEKVTLPELTLEAERDPNAVANSIETLQLNIKPVSGLVNWQRSGRFKLLTSAATWIFIALPLVILAAGYVVSNYRNRMQTDSAFARSQKAYKRATETLNFDPNEVEVKDGYNRIHKALTLFVADKLGLAEGSLSDQAYFNELQQSDASTDLQKRFRQLITRCSTISYIPDANAESLQQDISEATEILEQLKKNLK